jgi:hypothetical protein
MLEANLSEVSSLLNLLGDHHIFVVVVDVLDERIIVVFFALGSGRQNGQL